MRPAFRNAGERDHPGLAVADNAAAMRPASRTPEDDFLRCRSSTFVAPK